MRVMSLLVRKGYSKLDTRQTGRQLTIKKPGIRSSVNHPKDQKFAQNVKGKYILCPNASFYEPLTERYIIPV